MTTAWTRTLMALGLFAWSQGCVVSVDDDPDDNFGTGGTLGESGGGGRSGSGGTGLAGSSGSAGETAGSGGSSSFLEPTCEEEPEDELDECARCLKLNCCEEWLGCDDADCYNELFDVSECVQTIEFATSEDLGMCISASSAAGDDFVQPNTQAVIECAIAAADDGVETLCSSECFGSDIFAD